MTITKFINTAFGTPVTYLTTELNTCAVFVEATQAGVILGAAINNTTDRLTMCKVQIYLATRDYTTATGGVGVRLLESLDGGTTYEDNDSQAYGITLPIRATSSAKVRMGDLFVPPGYFKLAVVNYTGLTFAGSGNIFTYALYTPVTDV